MPMFYRVSQRNLTYFKCVKICMRHVVFCCYYHCFLAVSLLHFSHAMPRSFQEVTRIQLRLCTLWLSIPQSASLTKLLVEVSYSILFLFIDVKLGRQPRVWDAFLILVWLWRNPPKTLPFPLLFFEILKLEMFW